MTTHVVCYSGGKGSGEVAVEVVHRHGPDNVILLNHNINSTSEDDDIQRYKEELALYQQLVFKQTKNYKPVHFGV